MDPTLTGIVTCFNSTYLIIHGVHKIMKKCGLTVCFEKEDGDEIV